MQRFGTEPVDHASAQSPHGCPSPKVGHATESAT